MPPTRHSQPVLVVEDDVDSRIMLATILTMQGYEVLTASNGAEGLEMAQRHAPCVILLDLMMPVMDGEQFRAAQLGDEALRHIPVVVLTARHDGLATAERLRADSCILKPLNVRQVLSEVAAHCLPEMPHEAAPPAVAAKND
jgi:two-component system, chemotaxis family, chemotaxis protein CheY